MDDPTSRIERVKLAGRESSTHLADVDDLILYRTDTGGLIVEFVRWNDLSKPVESYRITLCPEDTARLRDQVSVGTR